MKTLYWLSLVVTLLATIFALDQMTVIAHNALHVSWALVHVAEFVVGIGLGICLGTLYFLASRGLSRAGNIGDMFC